MRVLIVGCGYVGLELGRRLAGQGHEVWGLRQSTAGAESMLAAGIRPVLADITAADALDGLPPRLDAVVNALSSKGGGEEGYRRVYLEGTRRLLAWARAHSLSHYLHVSSTSVYGQTDGCWVTESSPAEPSNATSRILVETEQLLHDARRRGELRATVVRSAGIYGPGRGHLFLQFLKGEATLTGEGSRWLNMIHRDDLAGVLQRLLERPESPPILNVTDDAPVTEHDFFLWLSLTLCKPMPPIRPAQDKARKRGATDKRVSNALLKTLLGDQGRLAYPTFKEGYAAEIRRLDGEGRPAS